MKIQQRLFSVCLGIFIAIPSLADAQGEKQPTSLQTTVGDVTDTRSTGQFNSECKVELKFTGDAAADAGSVRRVRLSEATDELGRNLIFKEDDDFSTRAFNNSSHSGGVLKGEVKLRNPSRNAATIKLLKGEVELFSPTETNGGLLTIKNVLQHPAEPIQNPVFAKYGIQLMYLTKETYEAKKKEIEAQKKSGGDADDSKLGEAFGDLFKGMFGGMMSNSKNSIQMYVKDPKKMVLNLKFTDSTGKALKSTQSWSSGDFRSTGLDFAPPADTQLMLQIATPEAVKAVPFKVENIPLP